jgi:DNA-binding transcriptional LysR family regulator
VLDWDDLKVLLAVHRAGSLAAAARTLRVDKATVSRRVAALLAELSEARGDATGAVYLSVPQFFASHVLMPALVSFRSRHPGIELIVNASSSVLNMAQREAEVGLRNVKPDQASVTAKRVGRLGSAVYASRDYLERRGRPHSPSDVARHELVAWDRAATFVPAFHLAGRKRRDGVVSRQRRPGTVRRRRGRPGPGGAAGAARRGAWPRAARRLGAGAVFAANSARLSGDSPS